MGTWFVEGGEFKNKEKKHKRWNSDEEKNMERLGRCGREAKFHVSEVYSHQG